MLENLAADGHYALRARIMEGERTVKEFANRTFQPDDLKDGRIEFTEKWMPDKLWDIQTPQNTFGMELSLLEADGKVRDVGWTARFGFREFWIEGRDFMLNGTRLHLSAVPLDNAQVSAAAATYQAARESLERLKSFGINFVYTHNYDCEPGSHLSFAEILRAADDVGMLVARRSRISAVTIGRRRRLTRRTVMRAMPHSTPAWPGLILRSSCIP